MCRGEEGGRESGEETSTKQGILTARLKEYDLVCCNLKLKSSNLETVMLSVTFSPV